MKPCQYLIALTMLLFIAPCLSYPGSADKAEKIVVKAFDQQPISAENSEIYSAVSDALNEGVSYEDVETFVSASVQSGRGTDETANYLGMITDLHRMNIPANIMINTILEGYAKNIPEKDMKTSVASTREKLVFCSRIAKRHFLLKEAKKNRTEMLVKALINVLNSGFSRGMIEKMSTTVKSHTNSPSYFISTLKIMMELKGFNLPDEDIFKLMEISVTNKYPLQEMKYYPQIFMTGKKEGAVNEEIYITLLDSLKKGIKPSEYAGEAYGSGEGVPAGKAGNGEDKAVSSKEGPPSSSPGGTKKR